MLTCGANKRCCTVPSLRAIIKLVLDIGLSDTLFKKCVLQKLNMYGTLVRTSVSLERLFAVVDTTIVLFKKLSIFDCYVKYQAD